MGAAKSSPVRTKSSEISLSIHSQRSRAYLSAALALVSVIPTLAVVVIFLSMFTDLVLSSSALQLGVGGAGFISGLAGFIMLRVYPKNLERLRGYLERIAAEDLPENATLLPGEQDLADIEMYLNRIIGGLHEKIGQLDLELKRSQEMLETIEKQSDEIVAAERQRVMLESLGAACHHIGQPATIIMLYLSRLREENPTEFENQNLAQCLSAVQDIGEILKKLKKVSEYRTVPYVTYRKTSLANQGKGGGSQIIDIEQSAEIKTNDAQQSAASAS